MSYITKLFVLGLGSVGLMLATESQSEAGCRHRHRRHHGHHANYCAPAPSACCNTAYAAPASNGCCTVNGGYATQDSGYGYSGQAQPQMAPSGSNSPSDMPAGSPPPAPQAPSTPAPPPAAQ